MSRVNVVSAEITPRLRLHLIASEDIRPGEVVVQCTGQEIQSSRTWRTLQLDHNRHLRNEFLNYVDHSCDPNAVLSIEAVALVAIRHIDRGEPVTFFYPGSEIELAQDFVCQCGSPDCLGHIKGGAYLTHEQMRRAIDAGLCTSFMHQQFFRLLGEEG